MITSLRNNFQRNFNNYNNSINLNNKIEAGHRSLKKDTVCFTAIKDLHRPGLDTNLDSGKYNFVESANLTVSGKTEIKTISVTDGCSLFNKAKVQKINGINTANLVIDDNVNIGTAEGPGLIKGFNRVVICGDAVITGNIENCELVVLTGNVLVKGKIQNCKNVIKRKNVIIKDADFEKVPENVPLSMLTNMIKKL